jgi:hypothetical protein
MVIITCAATKQVVERDKLNAVQGFKIEDRQNRPYLGWMAGYYDREAGHGTGQR